MICSYRHCRAEFEPKKPGQRFHTKTCRMREWGLLHPRLGLDALLPDKTKRSHAASLDSPRLKKTLECLERGPATTKAISEYTGSEAVHSDIHELRKNLRKSGRDIRCMYFGRTDAGRKIYRYEIITEVPQTYANLPAQ